MPNRRYFDNTTKWFKACMTANNNVITTMLKHGFDIDTRAPVEMFRNRIFDRIDPVGGITGLMVALQMNNLKCVAYLLNAGANYNILDDKGYSAYVYVGGYETRILLYGLVAYDDKINKFYENPLNNIM